MQQQSCFRRFVALTYVAMLALGPAFARAAEPQTIATRLQRDPGRKMLLSGIVLGGVGLTAVTVGFGTFGGIHIGNPGPGRSIIADDLNQAHRIVRVSNAMEAIGIVGIPMMIAGVVVAAVGYGRLRKAARVTGMAGPLSLSFAVKF